jgi:quercetin dioxygenase-like cupin family protein
MKPVFAVLLAAWACGGLAQDTQVKPVLPQDLEWFTPPTNATIHGAWVIGSEHAPDPYLFRVRLEAAGRMAPHTHPDTRNTTVLSGTLYVGFGDTFDETTAVAIPTGGVYVAPANVPHFVWAKDGEVVYQEAGVGPTATAPVDKKP